ncbi:Ras-related GTP-binding protein D-like [Homarus americanus]|uniref:Ras-related GTP-binding protein D-like n=1 Tax=Homarus americanus TaxID=6706 RepID=A0A8J5JVK9_HOMAM|nr:Ras-related GTP-binding protein D-like [Homarus americanus]
MLSNFRKDEGMQVPFDKESSSIIKLNNATILYLREVGRYLALVCILREDNFDRQGLIDYNFLCFRNAIQEVFDVRTNQLQLQQLTNITSSPHLQNSHTNGPTS